MPRIALTCVVLVLAIVVDGCGTMAGTHITAGHRADTRYAGAVNLRPPDVPGMRAVELNVTQGQVGCPVDRYLRKNAVAGISPVFESERGNSIEHMSSIVFVMDSDSIARRAASAIGEAAEPGPIRRCQLMRKNNARVTIRTEGASPSEVIGGHLYAQLRIQRSRSSAQVPDIYGVRTSGRYLMRGLHGESFAESVYAFACGHAVVVLDNGVVGRSVPEREISRLIVILHKRALADLEMID